MIRCEAGSCIRVTITPTTVEVADTKNPEEAAIVHDHAEWRHGILPNLIMSEYGIPGRVARIDDDTYAWCGHTATGARQVLWFDGKEWLSFVQACRTGAYRVPAHDAAGSVTA